MHGGGAVGVLDHRLAGSVDAVDAAKGFLPVGDGLVPIGIVVRGIGGGEVGAVLHLDREMRHLEYEC